jgi:hypothetical protein
VSDDLTITINGVAVTASMAEWGRVSTAIGERRHVDRLAWEAAQREAGQIWTALYMRYGKAGEVECFSAKHAALYLIGGSDAGDHAITGIRCPDGAVIDDWDEIEALAEART